MKPFTLGSASSTHMLQSHAARGRALACRVASTTAVDTSGMPAAGATAPAAPHIHVRQAVSVQDHSLDVVTVRYGLLCIRSGRHVSMGVFRHIRAAAHWL